MITRPPQAKTVRENATLQLTCEATGQPRPTITWSKDGVRQKSDGDRFEISSIKRSQAGTYTCTADNQVKDAKTASARVTVECKSAARPIFFLSCSTYQFELSALGVLDFSSISESAETLHCQLLLCEKMSLCFPKKQGEKT